MGTVDIYRREAGAVLVLEISGRVDNDGAATLEDVLSHALREGKHHLVLDMGKVTSLNSSGLRVLAGILTHARAAGGDLVIAALTGRVERVFEIIGFAQHFHVTPDAMQGIQKFREGHPPSNDGQ
ncbi:MAG: STAS domain-containing protein [Anaerolineae bacterium]|nr:STAS domain-containing protein [Anaerolineae bacterium]